MRITFALIAFFVVSNLYSQKGDFLLTQHFPHQSHAENTHFEITNDTDGRICVANSSGVLKYDGENWDFFKTPSAALSLALDSSDVVYVGCIGSVGMISFEDRSTKYRPIFQMDTLQDLFLETHFLNNKVYFMGSKNLIIYEIGTKSVQLIQGNFLNVYELGGEIFVNTFEEQTFRVLDTLQKVDSKKNIAYTSKRKGKPELVIDFEGNIFSYNEKEFKELPQNSLVKKGAYEVHEIQWINDSLFVCSTFERGLLFFNANQPKGITVTDYHSGLPDNEIHALHTDNSNGVWAAHEFGITQISPLFPAYSYSHFDGLSGNLISTSYHQDKLWVTTSLGLFYFDQDTIYTNQVYYELISPEGQKEKQQINRKEKKPSLLKRLFGKSHRATRKKEHRKRKGLFGSKQSSPGSHSVHVKGKLDEKSKYVRKVRKIPTDIKYSFRQVQGTNGKFLSIVPYKNKLLAISTSGVYEIVNQKAQAVIQENIRSYAINQYDQLVISTIDLEVKLFKLIRDVWVEQATLPTNDIIVNMKEDENGNFWMAGASNIYKTNATDTSFSITKAYELNNLHLDSINLMVREKRLYFVSSQGYFYYNDSLDQVVEDIEIKQKIGSPIHHLYDSQRECIWVYTGKLWYRFDSAGEPTPFEYLGLFPNLKAIVTSQDSDDLWLITDQNDILKYDPFKKSEIGQFDFFLRKVYSKKGEINHNQKFILNSDENFLHIELSKPDFLGFLNPEFQYKLEGLHKTWSSWTQSRSVDFNFLPEGKYKLHIKARDSFGHIEQSQALEFTVRPPYWRTPWFYAIQIILFGWLIYYASKLNQENSKNRMLRIGLTLLVLVLIIEFLQSAVSSLFTIKSTPVVDFIVDVVIAFFIFPFELLLREVLTKGREGLTARVTKAYRTLLK